MIDLEKVKQGFSKPRTPHVLVGEVIIKLATMTWGVRGRQTFWAIEVLYQRVVPVRWPKHRFWHRPNKMSPTGTTSDFIWELLLEQYCCHGFNLSLVTVLRKLIKFLNMTWGVRGSSSLNVLVMMYSALQVHVFKLYWGVVFGTSKTALQILPWKQIKINQKNNHC